MAFKWFKKKKKIEDAKKNDKDVDLIIERDSDKEKFFEQSSLINNTNRENISSTEQEVSDDLDLELKPNEILSNKKGGFFSKLRNGLFKTRNLLSGDIDVLFKGKKYIDDDVLEKLEELLLTSDIGVETTMDIVEEVSRRRSSIFSSDDIKQFLREELIKYLDVKNKSIDYDISPMVIMVVGVNGVGKTTTIGKLAALESMRGNKTLIAAADTFRAGAVEQVSIYAKRAGVDVVKHRFNADPAAVAYDGVAAAVSRKVDKIFIDTAGRLHTKTNLMEELKKIGRAVGKRLSGAPHEVLLILDATTGQNALNQAEKFNEALGITGIVLTKLDGTAKGGMVVNICRRLNIPIKYIGIGEEMEDLQKFDPKRFINAMF